MISKSISKITDVNLINFNLLKFNKCIENYYNMEVKNRFRCVNLLTVAKDYIRAKNYRLDTMERKFRIPREVNLKEQRGDIYQHWNKDPENVKLYNKQDVVVTRNLYKLTSQDLWALSAPSISR